MSEQTVRNWLKQQQLKRRGKPSCYGQAIPSPTVANLHKRASRKGGHRRASSGRLTPEHVGKVISHIGEHAGIVVNTKGRKKKFASAHDIRRGFAQRLINSGVSAETLKGVMRHREFATTEKCYGGVRQAQSAATELVAKLAECSESELVGQLVGQKSDGPKLTASELEKLKALLNSL